MECWPRFVLGRPGGWLVDPTEHRLAASPGEGLYLLRLCAAAGFAYHFEASAALAVSLSSQLPIGVRVDATQVSDHLRIERAKELLASEHLPITEVCFEVGFESLGSFSTLFARHVGESPSAFRRRMNRLFRSAAMWSTLGIPHCFLYWFGYPP